LGGTIDYEVDVQSIGEYTVDIRVDTKQTSGGSEINLFGFTLCSLIYVLTDLK
jgi:hypothetical protein